MLAAGVLIVLLGCDDKGQAADGGDSALPVVDEDDDGVPAERDCDDGNPETWDDGVVTGSLDYVLGEYPCAGLCSLTVDGDLDIDGHGDLSDLHCLVAITGDLLISGPGLASVHGLERLETIGGDLEITSWPIITDLDGLSGLRFLGGGLFLHARDLADIGTLGFLSGSIPALTLQGADIEDLSPLSAITQVEGDLKLDRLSALTTLSDLKRLVVVGGDLSLTNSDALAVVDFPSLAEVGGDVFYVSNPVLIGIEAPQVVGGSIAIERNDTLPDFAGWDLASVGGSLTIAENTSLSHLYGLEGVTGIASTVEVTGNAALVDLAGLDGLATVQTMLVTDNGIQTLDGLGSLEEAQELYVRENPALDHPGSLGTDLVIGGDLWFESNASMTSFAGLDLSYGDTVTLIDLPSLESYEGLGGDLGFLDFVSTDATDLRGLEAVAALDGLFLQDTAAVTLNGLEGLRAIAFDLWILDNLELADVTALHGLSAVGGDVEITGNARLAEADAQALIEAIDAIGGTVTVGP